MTLSGLNVSVARKGGIDTLEGCYRAKAHGATQLVISIKLFMRLASKSA